MEAARGHRFVLAAFGVAVLVVLFLALAPVGASVTETAEVAVETGAEPDEPPQTREVSRHTLAQSHGWGAVAVIGGPLLVLTALPALVPWRRPAIVVRSVSAGLLFAGVILGALSFGIYYLPAAALMFIAAVLPVGRTD